MNPANLIAAARPLLEELRQSDPADQATQIFHAKLIRHLKGILSAWEEWLRAKKQQQAVSR